MRYGVLLIFILTSQLFGVVLAPGNNHLSFRYKFKYKSFPLLDIDQKNLQARLDNSMEERRKLGWKFFNWLTEEVNSLPRMFHWLNTQELVFGLRHGSDTDKSFYKFLDGFAQTYPQRFGWDQGEFLFWSREKELSNLLGWKGMPRLAFDSRYSEFIHQKREKLKDCFVGSFPMKNCFEKEEVPYGATIVKFAWQRVHRDYVRLVDTDILKLKSSLNSTDMKWEKTIDFAANNDGVIYATRKDGVRFYLVGFHVMSKIVKDWFWASYWLDPKGSIFRQGNKNLKWKKYAACAVSNFEEQDLKHELGKMAKDHNHGQQWCSNPYLETEKKMVGTNCIGCHQYAGFMQTPESILDKDTQGQRRDLSISPHDYLWSFTQFPAELGYKLLDL